MLKKAFIFFFTPLYFLFSLNIPFLFDEDDELFDESYIFKPIILVNKDKDIAIAWIENDDDKWKVKTSLYNKELDFFSKPKTHTKNIKKGINSISFAMNSDGDCHLLWSERTNTFFYLKTAVYSKKTNSWSEPSSISGIGKVSIGNTNLSINKKNDAVCMWFEKTGSYYLSKASFFNEEKNKWLSPIDLTQGSKDKISCPCLKINEKGNAFVAFTYMEKSKWKIKIATFIDNKWKISPLFKEGKDKIEDLKIALNEENNAFCIWKEKNEGQWEIKYAYLENDWSIKNLSTKKSSCITNLSTLFDENNNIMVSYSEKEDDFWKVKTTFFNLFSDEKNVNTLTKNNIFSISDIKFAKNENNQIILNWLEQNYNGWELKTSLYNPYTNIWSNSEKISDISGNKKGAVSLELNHNNQAICSWIEKDSSYLHLKISYFNSYFWSPVQTLSSISKTGEIKHDPKNILIDNFDNAFCIWLEKTKDFWKIKTSSWDKLSNNWTNTKDLSTNIYCEVCFAILSNAEENNHLCSFISEENNVSSINVFELEKHKDTWEEKGPIKTD